MLWLVEGEPPTGLVPVSLSLEEARELAIGKVLGKTVLITKIPHEALGFSPDSGTDGNALDYAMLDPDYEEHGFDVEGTMMTWEQLQEATALAFTEGTQQLQGEDLPMEEDPHAALQAETEAETAFATSTLQLSLEHSVEVMVYQYDKFFGYGCWMTSIPTMN
jgi:hypothetical protein